VLLGDGGVREMRGRWPSGSSVFSWGHEQDQDEFRIAAARRPEWRQRRVPPAAGSGM